MSLSLFVFVLTLTVTLTTLPICAICTYSCHPPFHTLCTHLCHPIHPCPPHPFMPYHTQCHLHLCCPTCLPHPRPFTPPTHFALACKCEHKHTACLCLCLHVSAVLSFAPYHHPDAVPPTLVPSHPFTLSHPFVPSLPIHPLDITESPPCLALTCKCDICVCM